MGVAQHEHKMKPFYVARLFASADMGQWCLGVFFCDEIDCDYEEIAVSELQEV